MLKADYYVAPTELDRLVCEKLIPADHYLRRLKAAINFAPVRALVADGDVEGRGAPAEDPVRLLKLSLLQFQYDLSESQVRRQAQVTGAFGFFVDLARESPLPVSSLLSQFRTRRGVDRFTRVFTDIRGQGRAQGLVKARRRLKDAPPLIANLAIPSTLRLVAQTREQLVTAAEWFAASEVTAPRTPVAAVRAATAEMKEAQRLVARVAPLRALVAWGEQGQQRWREAAACHQSVVSEAQAAACHGALA